MPARALTYYIKKMEYDRNVESWVLASAILASSMAFIDGTALNVAMPVIQVALRASGSQLLWVVNSYLLMLAALILVGGSLGDRLGRKKVFGIGIALFAAASCACGLSPSIGALIAARAIQGLGGALMIPGSLSLIAASTAPERRGRAIGTWSAATTLVTVAGPALGGVLSDFGLWRAVFLINIPLGIAALAVLVSKVPESRDESIEGPIDVVGAALAVVALAALTYGFIEAPGHGFGNPRVIVSLGVGLLSSLAFVIVERRRKYPMLPMQLFASRAFSGANALTLLLYGALSAATFFLSLNFVQAQGYSKTEAGLSFLPFALILTFLSRPVGALADRRGPPSLPDSRAGPRRARLPGPLPPGGHSGAASLLDYVFPGHCSLWTGYGAYGGSLDLDGDGCAESAVLRGRVRHQQRSGPRSGSSRHRGSRLPRSPRFRLDPGRLTGR